MSTLPLPLLCLVTDRGLCGERPLDQVVADALRGDVNMVQLREKNCETRDFVELAERLLALTRAARVPLIINDRIDVAMAVGADGVHLGQQDMPVREARRLLGPDGLIGLSVESIDDAVEAEALPVDYLGISPVFATATKSDAAPALGLAGLSAIRAFSHHPLLAIGGINTHNVADVMRNGAHGIAVVSAICAAEYPEHAANELRMALAMAMNGS